MNIHVATLKKYAAQGEVCGRIDVAETRAVIRFVESGENKKVIITNLEQHMKF